MKAKTFLSQFFRPFPASGSPPVPVSTHYALYTTTKPDQHHFLELASSDFLPFAHSVLYNWNVLPPLLPLANFNSTSRTIS